METKVCTKCCSEKPISDFSFKIIETGLRQSRCKKCTSECHKPEYSRRYRARTHETRIQRSRDYRARYKDKIKNSMKRTESRYSKLKTACKKRDLPLSITLAEYTEIVRSRECYYCDFNFSEELGYNLNRIDSSKGYSLENVKPCCTKCNVLMMGLTIEELKARLIKIYRRLK